MYGRVKYWRSDDESTPPVASATSADEVAVPAPVAPAFEAKLIEALVVVVAAAAAAVVRAPGGTYDAVARTALVDMVIARWSAGLFRKSCEDGTPWT